MGPAGSQLAPTHVLAHLSDMHLIAGDALLHGHIDTAAQLRKGLARVEQSAQHFDALVLSGDLTDYAQPEAYTLLREIVEPVAERLGTPVIMTGGNHDERRALARGLYGVDTDEPQDAVTMVRGLRIISMDSALPGFHHGGFDDAQYAWLSKQLAKPTEHGSILVMHHPPIRYRSPLMQLLDFEDVARLRATLKGTDVRAILSGHLHVTSFGTLGTIPVFVAGGVSYVDDAGVPRELLMGVEVEHVDPVELALQFVDFAGHDLRPIQDGALRDVAEWQEGDPATDIAGLPRPTRPGPDYAGAHEP